MILALRAQRTTQGPTKSSFPFYPIRALLKRIKSKDLPLASPTPPEDALFFMELSTLALIQDMFTEIEQYAPTVAEHSSIAK
jgi:hypothetical protein